VYLEDTIIIEKEELIQQLIKLKCKFKMDSRRYHMLEACHLYFDHGYVKACLKRVSPIVEYGGEIHKTSPSKRDQERCSNLRKTRPSSSSSSGMHKANVCY
jgi:hypothetical protein